MKETSILRVMTQNNCFKVMPDSNPNLKLDDLYLMITHLKDNKSDTDKSNDTTKGCTGKCCI